MNLKALHETPVPKLLYSELGQQSITTGIEWQCKGTWVWIVPFLWSFIDWVMCTKGWVPWGTRTSYQRPSAHYCFLNQTVYLPLKQSWVQLWCALKYAAACWSWMLTMTQVAIFAGDKERGHFVTRAQQNGELGRNRSCRRLLCKGSSAANQKLRVIKVRPHNLVYRMWELSQKTPNFRSLWCHIPLITGMPLTAPVTYLSGML